jgi:acyl-CoA synthetase (AMP-forming)/AMP-acid ligase II
MRFCYYSTFFNGWMIRYIIISSGYTIGPFEVEDALTNHPAVKECAVVAKPHDIRAYHHPQYGPVK